MNRMTFGTRLMALSSLLCMLTVSSGASSYLSPNALALTRDGKTLFVSCGTGNRVAIFDTQSRKVVRELILSAAPSGLALCDSDRRLVVTCAAPESEVLVIDAESAKQPASQAEAIPGLRRTRTGHTAMAPVVSPDGKTLYVCCRFDNCVAEIDLGTLKERKRIAVVREPAAAALTHDGRFLLVANLLPGGRADLDKVAAVVSVLDTQHGQPVKSLELPNGGTALNDIRISPDGRYAVVTHLLARFHLPTTQLERGWMNTNAKTIIDLERMELLGTVLLDSVDRGAANPWGLGWSADGKWLIVALAGTHEISVTDWPGMLDKLTKIKSGALKAESEPENDLAFLVDLRQRLKLPVGEKAPRAVAVNGQRVYIANYFSDTIDVLELTNEQPKVESFTLGPAPQMDEARQGELNFHDASLSFQGWQSCSSCHPDARADALNWDLLNDGIGNPKNVKSLLLAHKTPPAMSIGIRETAEVAVRLGIASILFTVQPESVARSIDTYLKSLQPVPSPLLEHGKLSSAARRGEQVFKKAACFSCHPPGLFTDLQQYDVGTAGNLDREQREFDTPTLVEVWRTAPYLHDGSAATLHDVLTSRNKGDRHGLTSNLSPQEIADLEEYVRSL